MFLALLLLAAPRVELGSVSGVSDDDAQAVLQEVRSAVGPDDLELRVQVVGGVTRVLLVLELIAGREVDARAECSAAPARMQEARTCIGSAVARFVARTQPLELAPAQPAVVETERGGGARAGAYALVAVSGALAVSGVVLASYAASLHAQLEERPFGDDRFRELEQRERDFAISAGVVLGAAVVSLAGSLLWALLE